MPADLRSVLIAAKVADGAWGTELDKLGCPPGYCHEEWNLSHPDMVGRVAASYIAAGAQIIMTNTLCANTFMLSRHGMAGQVEALNRAGAQISRQAAGQKAWVFGSIGPSGKMVIAEEVTQEELYKAFFLQAKALAAGGVDAIVCETMTELAEILVAMRAAKDATSLPVVASMTFDTGADYLRTMMGTSAGQAAEQLGKAGADAIGCNCGVGIEAAIPVVGCLRQHTDLPIWAKPNAGLPEIQDQKVVYRETPEEFAAKVKPLLKAGANIVGGCCGTTPSHVAGIVAAIRYPIPGLSSAGP